MCINKSPVLITERKDTLIKSTVLLGLKVYRFDCHVLILITYPVPIVLGPFSHSLIFFFTQLSPPFTVSTKQQQQQQQNNIVSTKQQQQQQQNNIVSTKQQQQQQQNNIVSTKQQQQQQNNVNNNLHVCIVTVSFAMHRVIINKNQCLIIQLTIFLMLL